MVRLIFFRCNSVTSFFNFIASAQFIPPIHFSSLFFLSFSLSLHLVSFPFLHFSSFPMHPHDAHFFVLPLSFSLSLSTLLYTDADARFRSRVARKMKRHRYFGLATVFTQNRSGWIIDRSSGTAGMWP